ncbi:MAG: ABC transporter ATP-binding protein [Ignavibacteria bacterium]|nr:ABC transporter ATP-binding protein [Ignavibacteria bacterium]
MEDLIRAENLSFSYGVAGGFSLRDVNLRIGKGEFVSVIGRNGSGKSTLAKLLANQLMGYSGTITFGGTGLNDLSRKNYSKLSAYLPQTVSLVNEGISVRELVLQGRYSYKGMFGFASSPDDKAAAAESLERLGIGDLSEKKFSELSGGQKQKALIALALTQLGLKSDLSGKMLIVDEPLTYLDVSHQYEVFSLLRSLNENGLTIMAVVHDLNIALKFSGKCILMNGGGVIRHDETKSVITEEMLREHFLIESRITEYEKSYFINYLT